MLCCEDPAFKVIQYSLILSIGGNASFSSYEPVLPIPWLTALNLGAGVEQPFDCRHLESSGYAEVDDGWIGQWRTTWSTVCSSGPQAAEGSIIHLCSQEQKRPRRMWRRSSRIHTVLGRAILGGWVPMSRCRQYVRVDILSFLQNTAKQIRDMQKRWSEDRLRHFGQFVMFELPAKLQALHETFTYMVKCSVEQLWNRSCVCWMGQFGDEMWNVFSFEKSHKCENSHFRRLGSM